MAITNEQRVLLAMIIVKNIKSEFSIKKLSGNLANTIEVYEDGDGVHVHIPAKTYNMLRYQQEGVLIHTSNGSYASKLDKEGSSFMVYPDEFSKKGSHRVSPKNHIGYIDKVISDSIKEWSSMIPGMKIKRIEG